MVSSMTVMGESAVKTRRETVMYGYETLGWEDGDTSVSKSPKTSKGADPSTVPPLHLWPTRCLTVRRKGGYITRVDYAFGDRVWPLESHVQQAISWVLIGSCHAWYYSPTHYDVTDLLGFF